MAYNNLVPLMLKILFKTSAERKTEEYKLTQVPQVHLANSHRHHGNHFPDHIKCPDFSSGDSNINRILG